jgi:orotate phosphoribosyltransferase
LTVTLQFDDQRDKLKVLISKFVRKGEFKLKSGRISDKYFDIKSLFCNGSFALYAAKCIQVSDDIKYVGGMESGATPFATAVSVSFNYLPSFRVRKKAKSYGLDGRVISYMNPMIGKCIIVDDVITTGSSVDECVKVLKKEGHQLQVDSVVCIVDRTEGKYTKYPIISFYTEGDF